MTLYRYLKLYLFQKKTMERLLKKQETKVTKITPKGKVCKRQVPYIIYKICADMRTVTLPPGMEYPLTATRGYTFFYENISLVAIKIALKDINRPTLFQSLNNLKSINNQLTITLTEIANIFFNQETKDFILFERTCSTPAKNDPSCREIFVGNCH